jgi:sugar phosphate isomerase/epimerase
VLSISTSYLVTANASGADIVRRLEALDISEVELSYRIDEDCFYGIRKALNRSRLRVSSVHNFFPVPLSIPNAKGSGDVFLLSHPAGEERCKAVQWTKRSIEAACAVSAKAVVLHCGRIEMDAEYERLYAFFKKGEIASPPVQNFIHQKLTERETEKSAYLDSVLRSLEDLIPTAEQNDIILGLENRYHYHELPGPDEFEIIFEKFAGAPIGYWHDLGHAHAQESLGIIQVDELLRRYHNHLVGVHLHDARGLDDHIPPGKGEIDFKKIANAKWIGDDTLKVIELKPGTPDSEVAAGIRHLKRMKTRL